MSRIARAVLSCLVLIAVGCPRKAQTETMDVIAFLIPPEGVALSADARVIFNDDIDESTLAGRVVLERVDDLGGGNLTYTEHACAVSALQRELLIEPESPLEGYQTYRLTLRAGIAGQSRGPLEADRTYSFETEHSLSIYLAPFDVVRHGVNMLGVMGNSQGWIAVGEEGLALVSTPAGRFVLLPNILVGTAVQDVWFTGSGATYFAIGEPGTPIGWVMRYADGRSSSLDVFASADGPAYAVHGWSEDQVFATAGAELHRREGFDEWRILVPVPPQDVQLDPFFQDIWTHSGRVIYLAGTDGIYRSFSPYGEWLRLRTTSVPCFGISGVAVDRAVAVSGGAMIWIEGDTTRLTVYPGHVFTDVSWVEAGGATAVGTNAIGEGAVVSTTGGGGFKSRIMDPPEPLQAVSAWMVGAEKHAVTVGDAGTEFRFPNAQGEWTKDPLAKRDSESNILDWEDLMGCSQSILYGIRSGVLVRGDLVADTWATFAGPANLTPTTLFCGAENDLWVTAKDAGGFDRFVSHYDGTTWSTQWLSSMNVPQDICVTDDGMAFVACDFGTVYRVANGFVDFMSAVNPVQHLYGIWGTKSDSVYAVGENGTIVHYDGEDWAPEAVGLTTAHLRAVWGSGSTNVVAVGDGGTVLRFDGTNWVDMKPGDVVDLAGVDLTEAWTGGPFNIWALSTDGVVIHYDGAGWEKLTTGFVLQHLNALTKALGDVWIAGNRDLLLRKATPPDPIPFVE